MSYLTGISQVTLSAPMRRVEFHDETLRDGIQSPSIFDMDIEKKKRAVNLLASMGIDSISVGLPGAGPRAVDAVHELVEHIRDNQLVSSPACDARTHPNDIQPIIDISKATGLPIEAMMFLGTSPIRMYTEKWDEDRMEDLTRHLPFGWRWMPVFRLHLSLRIPFVQNRRHFDVYSLLRLKKGLSIGPL